MPLFIRLLICVICLAAAYAALFTLNALRIALTAYLPVPIRDKYRELSAGKDYVPYRKIPASASIVLVATEDADFYAHHGFSIYGIHHAVRLNRRNHYKKAKKRGGSTVTQQLVKNLYLYPKKTYTRKLAELFIALWVERRLSKRQILELYFNVVYYGREQYGIGPAARCYFDSLPCDLSLNQLVSLLCILPNPDQYNPLNDPESFQKVRAVTLRRLLRYACITPEYEQLLSGLPWNAYSGEDELTVVRSFLTRNPCYRENLDGRNEKVLRFQKDGPSGLMLHSVGCARPEAYGFLEGWNRRRFHDACVHAFIDANDGTVYQTLPWNYRGWHCGGAGNNTHIGVEMCEPESIRYGSDEVRFDVRDPEDAERSARRCLHSAVKLFSLLCLRFGLDSSCILSHSEGHALGIASDHKDPEHLWQGLGLDCSMDDFRSAVRERTGGAPLHVISGPPRVTHPSLFRWILIRLTEKIRAKKDKSEENA